MRLLLFRNESTEPYFNMACEEYLLSTLREPAVMLWRNAPAVIIGKNQNARENVDFGFAEANGIKVVRRLTGGGAVFHDLGNVNYTFIVPGTDAPYDFRSFSEPIIEALASLGISAECSGRNDLLADGRKFSGTARCEYVSPGGTLVMHHGTLLFDADISRLTGALKVDPEKIRSKGIKSTASRVVNLSSLLKSPMSVLDFIDHLRRFFLARGAEERSFSESDRKKIAALAKEKYASPAWIFRAGAEDFDISREKRYPFGNVRVSVSCAAHDVGLSPVISRASLDGDFFGDKDKSVVEKALVGAEFTRSGILAALSATDVGASVHGADAETIAELLFG